MVGHFDSILDGVSCIYQETIKLTEPFVVFASRFAHKFGTVVLLSGAGSDSARYNILGIEPWLYFYAKHKKIKITVDENILEFEANPLETLRSLLKTCDMGKIDSKIPIASGLMGYLAYDLKDSLETLPLTTIDDNSLPDILFFAPSIIVIQDILKNMVHLFVSSNKRGAKKKQEFVINSFYKELEKPLCTKRNFFSARNNYKSNLTHSEYIDAVKKIKKYIYQGHVYQVNMSQRFNTKFQGNAFSFFKTLYKINPAAFFAYINASDHQVVSSSPERLVMQHGRKVEVRPIKGTRPRGESILDDNILKEELLNSCKDDAELSMIVDLLRNDLGKVCRPDSVKVYKHKRLEAYHNVYHLVSVIKGELDQTTDRVDLIKAVFPGGSITGCPKIRAMEIIDELEVNRRHVYTGSIGYISFHNTMDLSVAIRTATIYGGQVYFSVGGGIVYDSDPEDEFRETLHKGKTIMDSLINSYPEVKPYLEDKKVWVWFNGAIKDVERAKINVSDLGFVYGFGFFETLFVKKGRIQFLKEHIERFNNTWSKLFKSKVPELTWGVVIGQVLKANGLQKENAAVKIMVTRGEKNDKKYFNGSILVTAKIYKHRLFSTGRRGLKVGIYPHLRHTPLAIYKTLNYLYYYLAGLWAAKNVFDEAIILNSRGTVSEGNSSNVFFVYGKNIIIPKSSFVLKGVTISRVIKELEDAEHKIVTRSVEPVEFFSADAVFLTNSLMGIVPVFSVNNKELIFDEKIVSLITNMF